MNNVSYHFWQNHIMQVAIISLYILIYEFSTARYIYLELGYNKTMNSFLLWIKTFYEVGEKLSLNLTLIKMAKSIFFLE